MIGGNKGGDKMTRLMHDGYGTVWCTPEMEPRWCYIGMGEETLLSKYNTIEDYMNDKDNDWTQFEISFNKEGKLKEFHYLVFKHEGDYCNLIGEEVFDRKKNIIGHSLLTDNEFKEILHKAQIEFFKNYNNIDWNVY